MLADSDRIKSYIGRDVILATSPVGEDFGQVVIVVGYLYDYAFLGDIPFGTASVVGPVKFIVRLGSDEYQVNSNSWNFPTQQYLEQWASDLPTRLEFVEPSLPPGAEFEEVRNVIAVALLQPGIKGRYLQEADELYQDNVDQREQD